VTIHFCACSCNFIFAVVFFLLAAVRNNKTVSSRKGRQREELMPTYLKAENKFNLRILIIYFSSTQFVIINTLTLQPAALKEIRETEQKLKRRYNK
jgi:hypothetical protein